MIKVGYLVSYDYEMLKTSISQIYNYVDNIYLAIDSNYQTWSGNRFSIPDAFFEEIKSIDTRNIIIFYFESFYIHGLSPIECETRERILLSKKMGKGWLIQLDVDEYIYEFDKVSIFLKKYRFLTIFPKLTPIIFRGKLLTLFREIENGYLYIKNKETFSFITNIPEYTLARNNNNIRSHYTNINVVHQSWARSENEILEKISNWGHRDDFKTVDYFNFWKKVNHENYKKIKNFHPISPNVWNELHFIEASNIDEFIIKFSRENKQNIYELTISDILKSIFFKFYIKIRY